MLAIKLRRIGKKHQPAYRVVVVEKRSKLAGRFVEDLGWLEPKTDSVNINGDRILYWMKSGAQPTDTVYNILVKQGVLKGKKRPVHKKGKKAAEAQGGEAAVAQPASPEATS